MKPVLFFIVLSLPLLLALPAWPQTVGDSDIELYTLTGSISMQGHGYTTTRSVNRREPLGGITTANLNYSVLGFSSGLNLRYSTDDNRFRQTMNRFSFFGTWRWLTLRAGDVNPSYSRYSVQGSMIRGGEISLTPGSFFLEAAGGRVNRPTAFNGGQFQRGFPYNRWLAAATLGVGGQNRSNFSLTALYGKDDPESLADTVGVNFGATRPLPSPAENLAITPEFKVLLFDRVLEIGAETTVSAFTRDLNSPEIGDGETGVPSFLTKLFTPRNSTRVTFAGEAHTALSLEPFQLQLTYERIQPGFASMGLRHIRDDQQTITISPAFQVLNNRLSVDASYSMGQDNLLGNRLSTQKNNNLSVNSRFQLTEMISLGGGYSRFSLQADANDTGGHRQLSQVFQLFPTATIIRGSVSHSLSASGIYQMLNSRFPVANGEQVHESNTVTGAINYSISLPTGLSLNGSANIVSGEAAGSEFTTFGVNAGGGYPFFDQQLNVNINAGFSHNKFERTDAGQTNEQMQLNGNISANYRLSSVSSLQFTLRTLNNNIIEGTGQGFSEMESRLQFQHRF